MRIGREGGRERESAFEGPPVSTHELQFRTARLTATAFQQMKLYFDSVITSDDSIMRSLASGEEGRFDRAWMLHLQTVQERLENNELHDSLFMNV